MHDLKPRADWRATLRALPVFVKVMGIALGMALFLGLGLFWQIHTPYSQLEVVEVEDYGRFMAQVVAVSAATLMRTGQQAEVQRLLDDMALVTPTIGSSIHTVQVFDGEGRTVAQVRRPLPAEKQERVLTASVGLPNGLPGRVGVELNDAHIDFELSWHTRHIVATTAGVALLGLVATWILMRLVTRPIGELAQVARAVRGGDYRRRVPVRARDELGELAVAFNQMLEALQQKEVANQRLLRKLIAAEEEERKRVARELHDQTGQALTSLIAGLAAEEREPKPDRARLAELRTLATETLEEVHDLSLTLRPIALEDLGLLAALQRFCRHMNQRFGIVVDCAAIGLDGGLRLPVEIEVALYRMVQEALSNAVRHGLARSASVLLHRRDGGILAVIEDNGQGFNAKDWRTHCLKGNHLGLLGIEERATLLGGTLRVESRPSAGTSLFIEIPLPQPPYDENPRPDCR